MKLIVLFILVSTSLFAASPYRTQDYIMESMFVVTALHDWLLTKQFRKDGKKESNPALGSKPSQARVDALILGGIVAHVTITYYLWREERAAWILPFIALEASAVRDNYTRGVRVHLIF